MTPLPVTLLVEHGVREGAAANLLVRILRDIKQVA